MTEQAPRWILAQREQMVVSVRLTYWLSGDVRRVVYLPLYNDNEANRQRIGDALLSLHLAKARSEF